MLETPLRRPTALVIAVIGLALVWPALAAGVASTSGGEVDSFAIFGGVFWTGVWYAWLYRVWRGGPMAVRFMVYTITIIPALMLLSFVIAVVIADGKIYPLQVVGLAATLVALGCGLLLRRREVGQWCAGKTAAENAPGRHAGFTPADPDATTIDLRGRALSNGKAVFGCGMILFVVIMMLIVGALQAFLDPEAVNVAFMIAVVICVAVGVAAYVSIQRRAARLGVLTIDGHGITCGPSDDPVRLDWRAFRAVGMSYRGKPFEVSGDTGGTRYPKAMLEFFPVASGPADHPWLRQRTRQEPPPRADLPGERYTLALPGRVDVHREIESALVRLGPDLWIGWFSR